MWKKHPIAHFVLGLALTVFLGLALVVAIPFGYDFWADSQQPPVLTEGSVSSKPISQPRTGMGRFVVRTATNQEYPFEIGPRLLDGVKPGDKLKIYHSPRFFHVYSIQSATTGMTLVQDFYDPNELYQQWQAPIIWLVVGIGLGCVGTLIYSLIALGDWFVPVRRIRGALVARVEQADNSAAGYALVLRSGGKPGARRETCRFQVNQTNFLATDQADYLELDYTPVFKYVRRLRILSAGDFESGELPAFDESGAIGIRYLPGWHFKTSLGIELISAIFLFCSAGFALINWLPIGFNGNPGPQLYERFILLVLALSAFVIAFLPMSSFLRKLHDLKAPKRVTVGPVLSKWRVTGGNNDTRRQIVVADGGLQAGSEGVRKFDVTGLLFDELKVGDIVEIEHSPRLRYIFRLEVTGHQEFLKASN